MKALILSMVFTCAVTGQTLAWGPEGHSIVAEIAQTRLTPQAAHMVAQLLKGRSLASIASWADDARDKRPETNNWHFVDIPLDVDEYSEKRDCKDDAQKGDCIVKELARLRKSMSCATDNAQVEALKFAVHFLGDIHQPLHTVLEKTGGNDINVTVFMRGLANNPTGTPAQAPANFHAVWDANLIQKTVWAWGAYVDRLEKDWLATSADAKAEDPKTNHTAIDDDTFVAWANETHKYAPTVWYARPANDVLDDRYLHDVLPTLDRQLGIAGLRLARLLNQVYESCPVH
jgi:hypothetical protein